MTRPDRAPRPVVVGVDGSATALRAVRWAAAEAARRDLPVRLVMAFPWPPGGGPGAAHREAERAAACRALERAAGAVPAGVAVTTQLRTGGPIGVLAEEAAGAAMVVVGDRGLTALDAMLAGSVPVALAAHGAGPVVVVRGPEPADPAHAADSAPVVVGVGGTADPAPALGLAFETAAARGTGVVAVRVWQDRQLADQVPEWDEAQRHELAAALAPWRSRLAAGPRHRAGGARTPGPCAARRGRRRRPARRGLPRPQRGGGPAARLGGQRARASRPLPGGARRAPARRAGLTRPGRPVRAFRPWCGAAGGSSLPRRRWRMLEILHDVPPGVLAVRASGRLTRAEYDEVLLPVVEEALREDRHLRCLCEVAADYQGLGPAAAWEDVTLGLRALHLFDGCAVVGDLGWVRGASRLAAFLMPCPVRIFEEGGRARAAAWLAALPEGPGSSVRLVPEAGVVVVEVAAPLRAADFDAVAAAVDAWVANHGTPAGVVVHAAALPGWENIGAMVRHLRFVHDRHRHVRRVALATGGALAELAPVVAGHFVRAELRHFDHDALDAAIGWAAGATPGPGPDAGSGPAAVRPV